MKRIQLIFCLFVFGNTYARSEEEQALVKIRLVPLGVKGQIRDVGLWKEGTFEALWIPSTYFPEPVDYVGPNPLTLVSMVTNEDGKQMPFPVAHAQLPEGSDEVLLLMVPIPPDTATNREDVAGDTHETAEASVKTPQRYGIKVIDFSPAVFPDNSFLLWNLTGRPLAGTVGKKTFRVQSNHFELLQPELQGEAKALDAKILYADDPSQKSYTSRKWFLSPGQKFMVIMTANPEDPNGYLLRSIRY